MNGKRPLGGRRACGLAALASLGLASAWGAPQLLILRAERRQGEACSASIRLYDLSDPAKIAYREYPNSFFRFERTFSVSSRLRAWQGDDVLCLLKYEGGAEIDPILVYRVDASLGLEPLGRLGPADIYPKAASWRAEDGRGVDVAFKGLKAYVRATLDLPLRGGGARLVEAVARVGVEGGAVSIEGRRDSMEKKPPFAALEGGAGFVGSSAGMWEILAWTGFDYAAAAPLVARSAAKLNLGRARDPGPCRFVRGVLYWEDPREGAGGVYDPAARRWYPRAQDFDLRWDRMLEVGAVLLVQPGAGAGVVAAYDVSDPCRPTLLQKHPASGLRGLDLGLASALGDTVVCADEEGYVARFRVTPDGGVAPLHPARELVEAVDRGDLAAVDRLADYQVDPLAPADGVEGESVPLFRALEAGRRDVLRVIADLERRHGRGFSPAREADRHPLAYALERGDLEAVRILAAAAPGLLGRRGDSAGGRGSYPLSLAARSGSLEAARLLLELGADPAARDFDGRFPSNCLSYARTAPMRDLLRERGCPGALEVEGEVEAVAVEDVNRIRAAPSARAPVLGATMRGDRLRLLAVGAEYAESGGVASRWLRVRTAAGLGGWTFGAGYRIRAFEAP